MQVKTKAKERKAPEPQDDDKVYFGVQVTPELSEAINEWVSTHPDTNQSIFARQAFREKLEREGIKIEESRKAAA